MSINRITTQRCHIYEQCVHDYHYQAELCRPHSGISELELPFQVRIYIDRNRKEQINHKHSHRHIQIKQVRQAGPDAHYGHSNAVHIMVKIKSVNRTLCTAHACQSSVKRITIPIYQETS